MWTDTSLARQLFKVKKYIYRVIENGFTSFFDKQFSIERFYLQYEVEQNIFYYCAKFHQLRSKPKFLRIVIKIAINYVHSNILIPLKQ